jgi:glycosyltransferase involved in cell wall biosynthesis
MSGGVSVVIPAHNAERWLSRALGSVMVQTRAPNEIIVVDDGSRDGTPAVARQYGGAIRYVYQANAGVSAARNRGVSEAGGEWIAFLDADDEWFNEKLERQMEIIEGAGDCDWCASACEFVRDGSVTDGDTAAQWVARLAGRTCLSFFEAARLGLPLQTSGFVIRKTALNEVGSFDPKLRVSEDRDLWARLAMRHSRLGYCAEVCYRYYENTPASLTKGAPERTAVVLALCRNLQRADAYGAAVAEEVYRYSRDIALDYLLRAAGRELTVRPEAASEVRQLFRPSLWTRILLAALPLLPARLAGRIVRRVSR